MFSTCLFFLTNALSRDLTRLWDEAFSELSLTASQAYMLVLIIRNPNIHQTKIAKEMLLEASTVTRSLQGLINKGLIQRKASQVDSRARSIQATANGRKLESRIVEISRSLNRELRKRYGETRLEKIRKLTEEALLAPQGNTKEKS